MRLSCPQESDLLTEPAGLTSRSPPPLINWGQGHQAERGGVRPYRWAWPHAVAEGLSSELVAKPDDSTDAAAPQLATVDLVCQRGAVRT